MKPPVFVLNTYSTVRADFRKQPFVVVSILAAFIATYVFFILVCYRAYSPFPEPLEVSVESITVSRLSAAGPECTVDWELKLIVTNPNSKHGFYLYFDDRLQATLFLHDRWLGGSFMVTTKSLPPPLLLTSETNQTATLSFKMQTDRAYLGEELIEEISRGIIQVHLNVMARYRLIPTTSKPEEFRLLRLFCPGMGLWKPARCRATFPSHNSLCTLLYYAVGAGEGKRNWTFCLSRDATLAYKAEALQLAEAA